MIIPEKDINPKKNRGPIIATFLTCLFAYLALAFIEIEKPETVRNYVREVNELNIVKIAPRPEIKPEIEEEPEQPESEETPEEPVEESVPEAPKRVNMDDIFPEGIKTDLTVDRDSRDIGTRQQTNATETRSLRIEDSELEQMSGLKTLSERGMRSSLADRRSVGNNSGSLEAAEITMDASSNLSGTGGSVSGIEGGSQLGGPSGRGTDLIGVEVGMKSLEDFGEDYTAIDYRALVEWMKDNPKDLPVPAKRLMSDGQFDQNPLTSRVPFFINDRQFDLLLMVSEQRYEVRIILIENEDATYLVDRGFRGESNRLDVGSVGYKEGRIAEIDSQMRDAGIEQTEEFYGVFLSWWDSVKDEYEQ